MTVRITPIDPAEFADIPETPGRAGRPRIPRTTPTEKCCAKCHQTRSARMFQRARKAPDGLQSWCRYCMSAHNKTYVRRGLTGRAV